MITRAVAAPHERRLLILAPVGKDADLIAAALGDDVVSCRPCRDFAELARETRRGAAVLLVAEEALDEDEDALAAIVATQPPWSDLPVLLLARTGADSPIAARTMRKLGNVAVLERPVRVAALVSAVRSAVRARERQYDLRALLEQRRQADERKDQFLATLAHELRNPLAPIRNALALLRLQGAAAGAAFEILERQVGHLVRLIDDLMDVARITSGKLELREEPVALSSIIAAAVETSRPLIEAAGHELAVSLPEQELALHADPVRLAQVFANLLNNAAKYTDRHGRISIAVKRDGDYAVVTVADTGIGIPAGSLPRVFDMFAQAEGAHVRSKTGLGIGLALARRLVELHQGSITATSEGEGRGSSFEVRLPLGPSAAPAASTAPRDAATCAPGRILVVDDNRDSANTMAALLQAIGADVRVAYDGRAALAAVDAFRPSAVLLDLGMPGMDGYEVARRIREKPDCGKTALIALTGWGTASDRRRTQRAGFERHLVKPVDVDTMRNVLASLSR